MPIYEYECTSCHHRFDLMQKISDSPTTHCPNCFENTAKKLISAAGFQLKGSGWYATDFKNKTKTEAPKSSEENGGKSGDTAASSTSTKGEKE